MYYCALTLLTEHPAQWELREQPKCTAGDSCWKQPFRSVQPVQQYDRSRFGEATKLIRFVQIMIKFLYII